MFSPVRWRVSRVRMRMWIGRALIIGRRIGWPLRGITPPRQGIGRLIRRSVSGRNWSVVRFQPVDDRNDSFDGHRQFDGYDSIGIMWHDAFQGHNAVTHQHLHRDIRQTPLYFCRD